MVGPASSLGLILLTSAFGPVAAQVSEFAARCEFRQGGQR